MFLSALQRQSILALTTASLLGFGGCAKPLPPAHPTTVTCARCPACPVCPKSSTERASTQAKTLCEVISPDKVTAQSVMDIVHKALLKATIDKDGDIRVKTPSGRVFLKVDRQRQIIRYFSVWGFKATTTLDQKLAFVNNLNSNVIFVRFYLHKNTDLICDHYVPFEDGIIPAQIIRTLNWFTQVERGGLTKYDPNNLVK